MRHFFQITVGRQCENVACGMRGKQMGLQVEVCEACQRPLVPVRRVDWRRAGLAAGIAVVLVTSLSWLTHVYLQRRAAALDAQRLSQATARFQNALSGATASDVDAILRTVKAEFQLTEEQNRRVMEDSRKLVEGLPRVLTADIQQRLELLVRDLYEDGRLSANDQEALAQFTREHRLAPQAAQAFETKLTGRLDESYRSISEAKSLAGMGKYEEARLALGRATQIDPGNAIAWANLGALHVLQHQDLEARTCYDKALSLDPENWLAHYNLGILAARGGELESAFQHLERALSALPPEASQTHREVIDGLLREPAFKDLRDDPRFIDLLGGAGARPAES